MGINGRKNQQIFSFVMWYKLQNSFTFFIYTRFWFCSVIMRGLQSAQYPSGASGRTKFATYIFTVFKVKIYTELLPAHSFSTYGSYSTPTRATLLGWDRDVAERTNKWADGSLHGWIYTFDPLPAKWIRFAYRNYFLQSAYYYLLTLLILKSFSS